MHKIRYLLLSIFLSVICTTVLATEKEDREKGTDAYKRGDFSQAFQIWHTAAQKGDHRAQFLLSSLYSDGEGVEKDVLQAAKWLQSSAASGFPIAQFNLGNHFFNGIGLPKDPEKAVQWWSRSARQGFILAQFNLGVAYVTGKGVQRDDEEGIRWLGQAAIGGSEEARKVLALNGIDLFGTRAGQENLPTQEKSSAGTKKSAAANIASTGKLHDAGWVKTQAASHFTIQLLSTADKNKAEIFARKVSRDHPVALFAFQKNDVEWHAVVTGSHVGMDAVNHAMYQLPLKKWHTSGWIRSFGSIQKIIQSK